MIKLVIFDVDGTLARAFTRKILPHVKDFFRIVLRSGCTKVPQVAIASNQGGVGMRYWMEEGEFGNPEKYPTAQEIEERLIGIITELGGDWSLPVYVSFRYQARDEKWTPIPPGETDNPRWKSSWRKPGAGMLIQAMNDAGARPEETLFIGDSSEDLQAAQSAGCRFMWAEDFFAKSWSGCHSIETNLSLDSLRDNQEQAAT